MARNKQYRLGKVFFSTKLAKEIWVLQGVLMNLEYMGKETKLSPTERALKKMSINRVGSLIRQKQKQDGKD